MSGVLAKLDAASPARRAVPLCLDGSTQARMDAIEATFQTAVDHDTKHGTLENPSPALTAAVTEREALREQVAASMVTFTFERVPWADRVAIQSEHPPRPGVLVDARSGFNFETFWPAMIRRSVVQVVDADGDTTTEIPEATWDNLLGTPEIKVLDDDGDETGEVIAKTDGSLNLAQVNKLINGANLVNEESPAVPLSALYLLGSQASVESSTQPEPGTSPLDDSKAGNPPGSPSSSTGTTDPTPDGSDDS